jgi:hypothetical protein
MTDFLIFVGCLGGIVGCIYWWKSMIEAEREAKRQTKRWYPRYVQDLQRAEGMMDADTLDDYAVKHYRRIIAEYRKRDRNADPYWTRSAQDLDGEYVAWLVQQPRGHAVLAWYAEPEKLFNAALRVRSTKDPAEEQSEWKIDGEIGELSGSEFRHLLKTFDDGGGGYDAQEIIERILGLKGVVRRAEPE